MLLQALWGLPVLLVLLLVAGHRRRARLGRLGQPALVQRLSQERSGPLRGLSGGLLLLGLLGLALAAARPQWGTRPRSIERRGIDMMVAVDASNSMLAEDFKPNRLGAARRELIELLGRRHGDRVGLVAFAGKAVTICPLTLDYNAVALLLGGLSTETVPEQGTSLSEAVRVSCRGFVQDETKFKALLLLTDGEDHEGDLDGAIAVARKAGVRVFCVGVGSVVGEPIPIRDAQGNLAGYRKDREGHMVMTHLEERDLQKLARETGGSYVHATAGAMELERVQQALDGMEKKGLKSGLMQELQDRFHWFAAAALALLSLEWAVGDRRRIRGTERTSNLTGRS